MDENANIDAGNEIVSDAANGIDYSQALENIQDQLEGITDKISNLEGTKGEQIDYSDVLAHIDKTVSHADGILGQMGAASNASRDSAVDYTGSLDTVKELLAYTDVLLLIVAVFLVLLCGLIVGKILTDRMKVLRG